MNMRHENDPGVIMGVLVVKVLPVAIATMISDSRILTRIKHHIRHVRTCSTLDAVMYCYAILRITATRVCLRYLHARYGHMQSLQQHSDPYRTAA